MLIARQPIFTRDLTLYGYELLFRANREADSFGGASSIHATASVMQSVFDVGFEALVGDKLAFVNFDEGLIDLPLIELMDKSLLVIEVLETTPRTEAVFNRIQELHLKGFTIALDDFDFKVEDCPLVPLSTIIKFDLQTTPLDTLVDEIVKAKGMGKILLAEKVESYALYERALEMGFDLFQGYFFAKPQLVHPDHIIVSPNPDYKELLSLLHCDEPSYQALAEIIERDVTLSYHLMNLVAQKSDHCDLYSIKCALMRLGLSEIERWVCVLMLQDMSTQSHKPRELARLALLRARFAEQLILAKDLPSLRYEAFMMGLFSVLDVLTGDSYDEALSSLAIPTRVKAALAEESGILGAVWGLIKGYEVSPLTELKSNCGAIGLKESQINQAYLEALTFSTKL